MTAVTAAVVGSTLTTVPPGPVETQIEPKPATTSRADSKGSVATMDPPGGSADTGFRRLVAARAARTTTSASTAVPLTPINSFREFTRRGYSMVITRE